MDAYGVQLVAASRRFHTGGICIHLAMKHITSHSLKLPVPQIGYSLLLNAKKLCPGKKVVELRLPLRKDLTPPGLGIARIETFLVQAPSTDKMSAFISWQSSYIIHGRSLSIDMDCKRKHAHFPDFEDVRPMPLIVKDEAPLFSP